jgi:hypothetical protein
MKAIMDSKAFVLFMSLLIMVVLAIIGFAMLTKSMSEKSFSQNYHESAEAFCLAETGLSVALTAVKSGATVPWNSGTVSQGNGQYYAQIEEISPYKRITSTGYIPNAVTWRVARTIEADVPDSASSGYHWSALANETVNVTTTGGITFKGDLGTKSVTPGAVNLSGSVLVKGKAVVGPGGDPDTVIIDDPLLVLIKGGKESAEEVVDIPLVSIPGSLVNQGPINLNNGFLSLPGGTYYYSSVNLLGASLLQFTGKSVLYLDGPMTVSGASNIKPVSKDYKDLRILIQGTGPLSVLNSSSICGSIYAPESNFTVNTLGSFKGGVTVNSLNVLGGSCQFYVDTESTVSGGGGPSGSSLQVLNWKTYFKK